MFVKNSQELDNTVECILIIFEMLVLNSGGLEEAEMLQQWRDAVRAIWGELESVRSIANRTDNVPHMLIGVDKYLHWRENMGTPGIPFPNWHQAIFPHIESITSQPWGSAGHIPMRSTPSAKGKVCTTSEEMVAMSKKISITEEDDNREEREVVEEDIKMDEAIIEPVHGKSPKQGRKGVESEGEGMAVHNSWCREGSLPTRNFDFLCKRVHTSKAL
ncbi:hypothetical protein EDC04DRAFT_2607612 [Pisolithus marmoratus]|nr:hypothetical protein EDC04DRAFT_2607612 [Pisolithus marmoratus]